MAVDVEAQLVEIASTVEPSGCEISSEAIAIAAESLYEIDVKYGAESDNPLSFHNADHSLGVIRRAVRFTNMLYPFMKPKYRQNIYDLDVIGGGVHDVEQLLGSGANEAASTDYGIAQVEAKGGPLNTDTFKHRLDLGVMATAVRVEKHGKEIELVQAQLQTGEPDPFKFIMGFGDINGIAMEGSVRMTRDATNLYYEITPEPTVDGLFNFLIGQEVFLSQRLNDRRVKADIAYHFPNKIEEVYAVMHEAFHENIVAAHGLAVLLGKRPELKIPVAAAVKTVGVLDKSLLGDAIGNAIRQHASVQG